MTKSTRIINCKKLINQHVSLIGKKTYKSTRIINCKKLINQHVSLIVKKLINQHVSLIVKTYKSTYSLIVKNL